MVLNWKHNSQFPNPQFPIQNIVSAQYSFVEPTLPQHHGKEFVPATIQKPIGAAITENPDPGRSVSPKLTATFGESGLPENHLTKQISTEFLIFIAFAIFLIPPLLLFVRDLIAWLFLRQMLRRSNSVSGTVVRLFEQIRKDSRRQVDVKMSDEIATPVVFGVFRTTLLLPSRITSSDELRACLVHEWSHLKNGDLTTWNLVRLFQYPLWMQPFYWMLRSRLLVDQDYLADDEAACECSAVADYAQVLFNLAQYRNGITPVNALGMAGQKSQLRRRIEMLLNPNRPARTSNKRNLILPLIFMTLFAVLGSSVRFGETTVADDKSEEKTVTKSEMQPLSIIRNDNKEVEIKGILYDKNGEPANNATILFYEDQRSDPYEPVVTKKDGAFVLKAKKITAFSLKRTIIRIFSFILFRQKIPRIRFRLPNCNRRKP